MRNYKPLHCNKFELNEFQLVPIRDEDMFLIMEWRNDQIYHLRQSVLLNSKQQEKYFNTVISKLFEEKYPDQLLFSFLEKNVCVGYGGLVHVNWTDQNAEVSFLTKTETNENSEARYWSIFLKLLDIIAFRELSFHKIFAYAFDVRPHLYKYLIENNYILEARLKDHYFSQARFYDVVIHSKFKTQ